MGCSASTQHGVVVSPAASSSSGRKHKDNGDFPGGATPPMPSGPPGSGTNTIGGEDVPPQRVSTRTASFYTVIDNMCMEQPPGRHDDSDELPSDECSQVSDSSSESDLVREEDFGGEGAATCSSTAPSSNAGGATSFDGNAEIFVYSELLSQNSNSPLRIKDKLCHFIRIIPCTCPGEDCCFVQPIGTRSNGKFQLYTLSPSHAKLVPGSKNFISRIYVHQPKAGAQPLEEVFARRDHVRESQVFQLIQGLAYLGHYVLHSLDPESNPQAYSFAMPKLKLSFHPFMTLVDLPVVETSSPASAASSKSVAICYWYIDMKRVQVFVRQLPHTLWPPELLFTHSAVFPPPSSSLSGIPSSSSRGAAAARTASAVNHSISNDEMVPLASTRRRKFSGNYMSGGESSFAKESVMATSPDHAMTSFLFGIYLFALVCGRAPFETREHLRLLSSRNRACGYVESLFQAGDFHDGYGGGSSTWQKYLSPSVDTADFCASLLMLHAPNRLDILGTVENRVALPSEETDAFHEYYVVTQMTRRDGCEKFLYRVSPFCRCGADASQVKDAVKAGPAARGLYISCLEGENVQCLVNPFAVLGDCGHNLTTALLEGEDLQLSDHKTCKYRVKSRPLLDSDLTSSSPFTRSQQWQEFEDDGQGQDESETKRSKRKRLKSLFSLRTSDKTVANITVAPTEVDLLLSSILKKRSVAIATANNDQHEPTVKGGDPHRKKKTVQFSNIVRVESDTIILPPGDFESRDNNNGMDSQHRCTNYGERGTSGSSSNLSGFDVPDIANTPQAMIRGERGSTCIDAATTDSLFA